MKKTRKYLAGLATAGFVMAVATPGQAAFTSKPPLATLTATATTTTLTGLGPTDPNANSGQSFLWFFHEDKAQVAVPSANAAAFANGDAFVTLYAAPGTVLGGQTSASPGGIHFAQNPNSFGGF